MVTQNQENIFTMKMSISMVFSQKSNVWDLELLHGKPSHLQRNGHTIPSQTKLATLAFDAIKSKSRTLFAKMDMSSPEMY